MGVTSMVLALPIGDLVWQLGHSTPKRFVRNPMRLTLPIRGLLVAVCLYPPICAVMGGWRAGIWTRWPIQDMMELARRSLGCWTT
jgi:hypothetical protein